ncbi:hypothetical protein Natoc_1433 [Natronococcus occultus SP4]|uniref:Uncharacterized protein n=2 Tax=Natronococcus occultus TaxID=29288 RepID=L0JYR0_9EURY|nr:hypothetical protein Natoc_1433 [Natronococcus occultus SP4]
MGNVSSDIEALSVQYIIFNPIALRVTNMSRNRIESNDRHSTDYYLPGTPTTALDRVIGRLERLLGPRGRIRADRDPEETNR